MSVEITILGVKAALKELREIDPEMRKQFARDAADVLAPVIEQAKNKYEPKYLSGMFGLWTQQGRVKFPYSQTKARRGISVKVDASKKNTTALAIIQKDPAAIIIDMAGKTAGQPDNARSRNFITQMAAFGKPSRVMWPAWDANETKVERNIEQLIDGLMEDVSRKMIRI